jgi:hypothetical protein
VGGNAKKYSCHGIWTTTNNKQRNENAILECDTESRNV